MQESRGPSIILTRILTMNSLCCQVSATVVLLPTMRTFAIPDHFGMRQAPSAGLEPLNHLPPSERTTSLTSLHDWSKYRFGFIVKPSKPSRISIS